jgi:hypothetical protein
MAERRRRLVVKSKGLGLGLAWQYPAIKSESAEAMETPEDVQAVLKDEASSGLTDIFTWA